MSGVALSGLIWQVADLLRGDYKPAEYGRVILPFTVLRRLDCVLAPTKAAALGEKARREGQGLNPDPFLRQITGVPFYNTSPLDLPKLVGDQDNVAANLVSYVGAFPEDVRDIFERYRFAEGVDRLRKAGLLYQVVERFARFDLSPTAVPPHEMGLAFEELIRKFADAANDTAGEQFTPRDAIQLMVSILFAEDHDVLTPGKSVVRTIYDPTAGTGGMLSEAENHLHGFNKKAVLTMFGQELNDESYAICKADMLIKGQDVRNIVAGNTLSDDGHRGRKFDYMLSNPPFGVKWEKVEKIVREEHERLGHDGRFGPGVPRVSDGSMLFLLHLLSKMRPAEDGGSRIAIVLNGSPLFTGGAGSGESEIRRHVLEGDLLEAIIALPTDMFFNTGIATYVWVLSNRKPEHRRGKVQLIDASGQWAKMRRSQGQKRRWMEDEHVALVTRLFQNAAPAVLATITDGEGKATTTVVPEGEEPPRAPVGGSIKVAPVSLIFDNAEFGYRTITVERPLLGEDGKPVLVNKGRAKGRPMPDGARRDVENVSLNEDVGVYFEREVLPHAPDAWIDHEKTKVGYEIHFSRHFYIFDPPRSLQAIDADLRASTSRIREMLDELAA